MQYSVTNKNNRKTTLYRNNLCELQIEIRVILHDNKVVVLRYLVDFLLPVQGQPRPRGVPAIRHEVQDFGDIRAGSRGVEGGPGDRA